MPPSVRDSVPYPDTYRTSKCSQAEGHMSNMVKASDMKVMA